MTTPSPPATAGAPHHRAVVHARITRALLDQANQALRDPAAPPHGYVRRHLVEHAADAGALDRQVLHPRLLPYLDADRLRGVLPHANDDAATRDLIAVWRRTAHQWDMADPAANAATLDFTYRALGRDSPLPATATGGWHTHLAGWPAASETLTGHEGLVRAVAIAHLDGRPVAVTGSDGGAIRIWDLSTGRPHRQPLTGHTGWVNAVAIAHLDGRPVAVTGGSDGAIRIWDLSTGRPHRQPLTGHTGSVNAVAIAHLDGRPVAVTGGSDGAIRIWDLSTGRPHRQPLTGH
ncbi:MAG: hypothetical protein GEU94_20155, partial [Micromonosporaceae bacterium]|nr:hypothetical protein [Micromonosporaceae bacterium]